MTDRAALADALRGLLGPGVGVGVADPADPGGALLPEEAPATARMTPARLREFTAGRTAARAAMADAGLPAHPVTMGPDRAPIWPEGLIGSIAHCRTAAIAAVARPGPLRALGLDIEEAAPLEPDLWTTVLTPRETDWARAQPAPGLAAKWLFTAKEAAYKAQYPLTGRMLDFGEVTIRPETEGFSADLAEASGLRGRWGRLQDWLLATATLGA